MLLVSFNFQHHARTAHTPVRKTTLVLASDFKLIELHNLKIGHRRYEIVVTPASKADPYVGYRLTVYQMVNKHFRRIMTSDEPDEGGRLGQAWFAIYKGVPFLAVSASSGSMYNTDVWRLDLKKRELVEVDSFIVAADASDLCNGKVTEWTPSIHIDKLPKNYPKEVDGISTSVPCVHRYHLKTDSFSAGPYNFSVKLAIAECREAARDERASESVKKK